MVRGKILKSDWSKSDNKFYIKAKTLGQGLAWQTLHIKVNK